MIGTIDGEGEIVLRLKDLSLASGNYLFSFSVHSDDHTVNYHRLDNYFIIGVNNPKRFDGCVYLPTEWGK